MFSRDFARGRTWPVYLTVDLALNFHKKIPLYVPSSLNISEGGPYCLSTLDDTLYRNCQKDYSSVHKNTDL